MSRWWSMGTYHNGMVHSVQPHLQVFHASTCFVTCSGTTHMANHMLSEWHMTSYISDNIYWYQSIQLLIIQWLHLWRLSACIYPHPVLSPRLSEPLHDVQVSWPATHRQPLKLHKGTTIKQSCLLLLISIVEVSHQIRTCQGRILNQTKYI